MNSKLNLLLNPLRLARRIQSARFYRKNPTAPWLCPGAISFLDAYLNRQMIALEFGSGRSTAWVGQRVHSLTSIEYDSEWHANVVQQLASGNLPNVECRYVPLDHPHEAAEQDSYDPMPAYVCVCDDFLDESLDFVLVDGHYRTHCIARARRIVKPGGVITVDDAQRWGDATGGPNCLLLDWEVVDDSSNGLKRTTSWRRPG